MPRAKAPAFSRLQSALLLGAAGIGLAAGAMPELTTRPGWPPPQAWMVMGGAVWLLWHRLRAQRRHALHLRLNPDPFTGEHAEGMVCFTGTGPESWSGWRGDWCLDLHRHGPDHMPWQLELRGNARPEDALLLAQAGSLDAVLKLGRRLMGRAGRAILAQSGLQDATQMLDCDFCFLLGARGKLTALAEGGYALSAPEGCRALTTAEAEALLYTPSPVAAARS